MKRKIVMALTLLSTASFVFAQQVITEHPEKQGDRANAKFEFYLKSSNKLVLEFDRLQQVDSLPNLDSLLNIVWNDIRRVSDSLEDPLASRRISYTVGSNHNGFTWRQYPQLTSVYSIRDGEITQLKTEQDTLRIQLMTRDYKKHGPGSLGYNYYWVNLYLNHITDLPEVINSGLLSKSVVMLKDDLEKTREDFRKYVFDKYRGLYNVVDEKVWQPVRMAKGEKKHSVSFPVVQVGIQYVNGNWAPSAGAGIELVKRKSETTYMHKNVDEQQFHLIWEPYFFFQSDSVKSFNLVRNDFITFRYHHSSTYDDDSRTVQLRQTLSVGYLIRRKGNYFEPTTFKFSLPGLQTKSILLEPEFVFNDFFKNFSPSLKLLYFFEED